MESRVLIRSACRNRPLAGPRRTSPDDALPSADTLPYCPCLVSELTFLLVIAAALLAVGMAALAARPGPLWSSRVYGGTAGLCALGLGLGLGRLLAGGAPRALALPLGLPWLGMHSAARRAVGLLHAGGRPGRRARLPVRARLRPRRDGAAPRPALRAAFLAGMNLVLLADDAFTFLLAWEFMSLTSWALVLREHESQADARGRLSLPGHGEPGTAALLLCSACSPGRAAPTTSPASAAARPSCLAGPGPGPGRARRRLQGRAWCRCMSGCRRPTPPHPATSPP